MTEAQEDVPPQYYVSNIASAGFSIYDPIEVGDPHFWIPTATLEMLLNEALAGLSVEGLALRTRSKFVKEAVCKALGYPVPTSFTKTQPRFPGQQFDTYVQKNNNLQVWNEELSPTRRYVLIRVSNSDLITKVKVINGDMLARLDTTGTLTKKYQARCIPNAQDTELVSDDSAELAKFTSNNVNLGALGSPVQEAKSGELLPISEIYNRLKGLVGSQFKDAGIDQERNRGAALHRLVCQALGYSHFQDDGQFPDVRHQLLEIKLQTSPTIDLGLVSPDSEEPLDAPMLGGEKQVQHREVRYAVFYAKIADGQVTITHVFLVSGASFFTRFPKFGGKVINAKLQIPLPSTFFEG